jgi:hypothetical protein
MEQMRATEREAPSAGKSFWQKGCITVSAKLLIEGFEEFSSPLAQITNAAKKELGAFLCAVRQVFGHDEVERAADLWIASFEATDWIDSDQEQTCRRVTIQTLAQLVEARTLMPLAIADSEGQRNLNWSRQ